MILLSFIMFCQAALLPMPNFSVPRTNRPPCTNCPVIPKTNGVMTWVELRRIERSTNFVDWETIEVLVTNSVGFTNTLTGINAYRLAVGYARPTNLIDPADIEWQTNIVLKIK